MSVTALCWPHHTAHDGGSVERVEREEAGGGASEEVWLHEKQLE